MEFIKQFYRHSNTGEILVSAAQGSAFAKNIADDFNPIHNPDSRRFCVPGDLLFGIALHKYGLHQDMTFRFHDLVSADTPLAFPERANDGEIQVVNDRGKLVLDIDCQGGRSKSGSQTESLLRNYVAFSGHNFPHIMVPLMQKHNVMINPARPLVIYQSMSLHLEHLNFASLEVELTETRLEVNGKRGDAHLHFSLHDNGKKVGEGLKNLVLSGLRDYDPAAIEAMQQQYLAYKQAGLS